ncbi:MAG TPA: hypothetical protein VGR46_15360 [Candidatus Limnocylindria bacterium]|nr:hypothetical protein [Candidatus Limnocylindria bacterium]
MEIVEQPNDAAGEWHPWEPPTWLVALGLCLALVVGFVRASDVRDPRLERQAGPTPCVPRTAPQPHDVNYVWIWCP